MSSETLDREEQWADMYCPYCGTKLTPANGISRPLDVEIDGIPVKECLCVSCLVSGAE